MTRQLIAARNGNVLTAQLRGLATALERAARARDWGPVLRVAARLRVFAAKVDPKERGG